MAVFEARNSTDMTKIVLQTLDPSLFGSFQSVQTSPSTISYNVVDDTYSTVTLDPKVKATYGFGGTFTYENDSSSNITGIDGNVNFLSNFSEKWVYYSATDVHYFKSVWEISGFDLDVSEFQTKSTQAIFAEIFSGNDTIRGGVNQVDYLLGYDGDDLLIGNGGLPNNTRGGDTLDGGAGADTMIGGIGNTVYYVDNLLDVVTEDFGGGNDTVYSSVDYVLGQALDNLFLTGSAAKGTGNELKNKIYGNAQNNILSAGAGDDVLLGGDGDDVLIGGTGADFMDGGNGIDTVDYSQSKTAIVLTIYPDRTNNSEGDSFNSIEILLGSAFDDRIGGYIYADVLHGNDGNDTAYGGYGDDRVYGDLGDDTLFGGGGKDSLYGGSGNDVLHGGIGADLMDGGSGSDAVSYADQEYLGVSASLAASGTIGPFADGDIFRSIENLIGSKFADELYGDAKANVLDGGLSNDLLNGAAGNDTLIGGGGADKLYGEAGTDTASYAAATKGVIASLSNMAINTGDATGDTYSQIENITGSGFNDSVYGNSGNNVVDGGAGNDILKGYAGNDRLIGGAGKDTFIFNTALSATTNVDVIESFKAVDDTIWVDNQFFKGLKVGALASGAFHKGAAAADTSDRIIYDPTTGKLSFDIDGAGGASATQFALLSKNLALTSADFIVI